jgi:hypothetical protein
VIKVVLVHGTLGHMAFCMDLSAMNYLYNILIFWGELNNDVLVSFDLVSFEQVVVTFDVVSFEQVVVTFDLVSFEQVVVSFDLVSFEQVVVTFDFISFIV